MDQYVGLDLSLKQTSVCVMNAAGAIVFEGQMASDPERLIRLIRAKAPQAIRERFPANRLSLVGTGPVQATPPRGSPGRGHRFAV